MAERSITLTETCKQIEAITGIKPNLAKNVIKALQEVAADELSAGRPFSISGFVKFAHGYKPALKKGRIIRDPSTGETRKAEEGRPASISIRARALRGIQQAAPSPASRAGKPIADAGKARAEASAQRKAEREAAQA